MIIENSMNLFRLLRTRWHVVAAVLGILIAVELINDHLRVDHLGAGNEPFLNVLALLDTQLREALRPALA